MKTLFIAILLALATNQAVGADFPASLCLASNSAHNIDTNQMRYLLDKGVNVVLKSSTTKYDTSSIAYLAASKSGKVTLCIDNSKFDVNAIAYMATQGAQIVVLP